MAEFLAFFSKTVAERCAEGSRQSVEEDQCVFHAHARADGLVGVVICDPEYPWRVAFSLIGKMMEEFTTLYNDFDINPPFFAGFHQRRHHSTGSRGLHHAAR